MSDWDGALTPAMRIGRPREQHQISMFKTCSRCGDEKQGELFHVHPASKDGRNSFCKKCDADRRRERSNDPEWRAANNERSRKFRAENPYTWRAGQLNKKAKKYGLPGRVTKAELEELWTRHDGKCFLRGPDCAVDACEWDHAIPVTRFGATGDISNLYPACRSCNAQKSALTLIEWRRELRWRQLGDGAGWIHPLALVGEPPEHRDHFGAPGVYPEISASAVVDAFCTVDSGVETATSIGDRSWLQKRVHIGHDAQIGNDVELCVGVVVCGHVRIGDGAMVSGNAWIKPRVSIGAGAIIGGGAVVTKDVPAHEVWAGNPARYLKDADTHPRLSASELSWVARNPFPDVAEIVEFIGYGAMELEREAASSGLFRGLGYGVDGDAA